jgi:predicted permease
VVFQLTLALSLLVVAGLTIRASIAMRHLDFGFDHRNLTVFRVDLPRERFGDQAAVNGFFAQLVERVAALPSVEAAGAATALPALERANIVPLAVEGAPPAIAGASPVAASVVVTPTFLRTLRIPIVAGRGIDERDTAGAPPTVVVSRALVARHFGTREALGARIRLGPPESTEPWRTIVGVVGDVHNDDINAPPFPHAYVPVLQRTERGLAIFVRTKDSAHVLAAARAELARIDPEQPLYRASTLEQIFFEETASDRVVTGLFVVFALVALGMGAVGLYAVVAYAVSRRTREIGVRMALGAAPREIVRMVMGQGARLTAVGLGLGLLVGLGLARGIAGALYGVGPMDPWTFSGVVVVLGGAALLASWIPARRASRVDPLTALHIE